MGYKKPKRFKRLKKKGFRASRIFEWLHVDITYVQTLDEGLQAVAFVKDNFSKAILHYASTNGKAGSEFIKTLFQETFDKYNIFDVKDQYISCLMVVLKTKELFCLGLMVLLLRQLFLK